MTTQKAEANRSGDDSHTDTPSTLMRVGAVPFHITRTPLETWVPTQLRMIRSWLATWWENGERRSIPRRSFEKEQLPLEASERHLNEAREISQRNKETNEIRQRRLLEDLIRPAFPKKIAQGLTRAEAMLDYATIAERLRRRLEKERKEGTLTRERFLDILRHQRLKKIVVIQDGKGRILGIRSIKEEGPEDDDETGGTGATLEIATMEEDAIADTEPEIQRIEIARINKDSDGQRRLINEILESFGVEEYPRYIRKMFQHLKEDATINTQEAWKISTPEYQRLALMADNIIKNVLGVELHPDIAGMDDAELFQQYTAEAKLETPDDFHRLRSNFLKLNVLFALQDILQRYSQGKRSLTKQLHYFSHQLDVLLSSIALKTAEGYILNAGSNCSITVKDLEVSEGKGIESAVIKFLIRDEGHGQGIRDLLRCRVELRPEDCRTEEDIHQALTRVAAIVLKALGTTTIQKGSFDYINITPLEPGEEDMELGAFLEKMREREIESDEGEHGLSSNAYRGIQWKVTWHASAPWKTDQHGLPAGIPQTVEVQIRLPTPDDHEIYKKKECARILELFAFGKQQPEEGYETLTFTTFIKDLIHGLNTGEDPGEGHYQDQTYEQTLQIVLRAITKQERGKLVNSELIESLKQDEAVLGRLKNLLGGDAEVLRILESETLPIYPYELRESDGTIEFYEVDEGRHYLKQEIRVDGTRTHYHPNGSIEEEQPFQNLAEELYAELEAQGKEEGYEPISGGTTQCNGVELPDNRGYYVWDNDAHYLYDKDEFDKKKITGHLLRKQYRQPRGDGVVEERFEYDETSEGELIPLARTDYLATPEGTPDLGRYSVYQFTDQRPWWNLGAPAQWVLSKSYDRNPETGEPVQTTYRTNWCGKPVPIIGENRKSRWHF